MHTKIHKPKTKGKSVYDNKGSAGKIINYLRSEELKEDPNAIIKYQTDKGDMNYGEAVQYIDNHSKSIEEGKTKFTAITFNLSQEEALALDRVGRRDKTTKEERVQDLTKKLMNEYAGSFKSRKLKEKDLVYVAKVHEHRGKGDSKKTENQTHIHIVVSNRSKDGKKYINPETKYKKQFSKVGFFTMAQYTTSEELGTKYPVAKSIKTEFSKGKTANIEEINKILKENYYAPNGGQRDKKDVSQVLSNNVKGLGKEANKITIIEMTPKKGNYFNNPENAKKSAAKVIDNYAKSLKAERVKKEDFSYYYRVNTPKGKNPSLEIVISNRDRDMKRSVGANAKSFDFEKFAKLNNQFNNQIVREKNHISPTEKNVYVLNKKYGHNINYKESYGNRWLGKDSDEYENTKKLMKNPFTGNKGVKSSPPIKEQVTQAIGKGGSLLKRMIAAQNVQDDYEIEQAIKKRQQQNRGLVRERTREKGRGI